MSTVAIHVYSTCLLYMCICTALHVYSTCVQYMYTCSACIHYMCTAKDNIMYSTFYVKRIAAL